MTRLRWRPFAPSEGAPHRRSAPRAHEACVVVAGVFDGLHRGHQALVSATVADARERGAVCVALTFDPDPAEVLGTARPSSRLLDAPDRVAALVGLGVDEVVALPFTSALAAQEPERFVRETLAALRPACVHVGTNFRFGAHGAGDTDLLTRLGAEHGFAVRAHELVRAGGRAVSATRIRDLLHEPGSLDEANELLGRCHYVRGRVEHGRGEGTSFGFPTANIAFDRRTCLPAEGVYACYVACDGRAWPAAANVGAPPTFMAARPAFLEANLLGFSGDLYGAEVAVSFVEWLRPSRPFSSLDELERVVLANIDHVRTTLGSTPLDL